MLRRRVVLLCAFACLALPAPASAAPGWVGPSEFGMPSPQPHSGPGGTLEEIGRPAVGMDAAGNVVAMAGYNDASGPDTTVIARPAGGTWSNAAAGYPNYGLSERHAVDVSRSGHAITARLGAGWINAGAVDARDGILLHEHTVADEPADEIEVAVAEDGTGIVAWINSSTKAVRAAPVGTDAVAGAPVTLGADASSIELGMSGGGDAVIAWTTGTAAPYGVKAKRRSASGTWDATAADMSSIATTPVSIDVATDGGYVLAWVDDAGSSDTLKTVVGQAASSFPATESYATPAGAVAPPVAVWPGGRAVVAWKATDGMFNTSVREGGAWVNTATVGSVVPKLQWLADGSLLAVAYSAPEGGQLSAWIRPASGGVFPEAMSVNPHRPGETALAIDLAADDAGNAVVMWSSSNPAPGPDPAEQVMAMGFDASGPALVSADIPASAQPGQVLQLKAEYTDVWSPLAVQWNLAGTVIQGRAVSHAFLADGVQPVTVKAVDALGHESAVTTRTVAVGDTTPRDTAAPVISGLSASNRTFRVGAGRTAVSAAAKKGTSFRFKLSEASKVAIGFQRPAAGRRVGKACAKQTSKNRRGKPCTRWVTAARPLTRSSNAGQRIVPFSGRVGRTALKPGRYRATFRAVDPAGNRSAVRTITFKIVRR